MAARAAPVGSQTLPPNVNLKGLVGVSRDDVLRLLHEPDSCDAEATRSCTKSDSWTYRWGPLDRPFRGEEDELIVKSGGPYLLILRFKSDRVSMARWQVQR
jgi:hypothetical protein